MAARGAGVVAGDHDRADAHRPQLGEALAHAGLDDVGQADDAEHAGPPVLAHGHGQRRAALVGDPVDDVGDLADAVPAQASSEPAAPLRISRPSMSSPDMRVCAVNGTNCATASAAVASGASPYSAAQSATMLRPSGVWSARLDSRAAVGQLGDVDAGGRDELGRLPVAEGDRAGLVEQQRVDVARGLHRAAGGREHVALHEPVHAGDADRGEQRADGRRDEADQQRGEHDQRLLLPGVGAHRLQRHHGEQEDDRERGQQDRQRDLVGRLLPGRALDQRDHAVDERLARPRRDLHDDAVGQHGGAAGDRAAVAARLADDRRRLAGDRRLVDGRDALDDVAVARDRLARLDDHEVADGQLGAADPRSRRRPTSLRADRLLLGAPQRLGLGLAPALRDGFGEVGEEHGEPQPDRDEDRRTRSAARSPRP